MREPPKGPAILVVEDEFMVRTHIAMEIKEAGYTVFEANDADEAISVLEAHKEIRTVFTDIEMPGSMDGVKLARAIRDRWPPIEIILTSGKHRLDKDHIPERGKFFSKPYNPSEVIEAIGSLTR